MFTKKCFVLMWISVVHQCSGIKQDSLHRNASDRMLSLNLNLQHSMDESASTVVAIDPVKSFLIWTILEAVALGFITTAAIGSMHINSYSNKHFPSFYHSPYESDANNFDDFHVFSEELQRGYDSVPIATDFVWPSDTKLYLSIAKNNSTEISKPCLLNITKKADINPS